MQWAADGARQPTSIFEAACWHFAVRPVCRCGHSSGFNAHGLWWLFERRCWDDRFPAARARFWCRVCGLAERIKRRPVRIEAVAISDTDVRLPWPEERAWRKAVSRFRA